MITITAVSRQVDDPALAARELAEGILGGKPLQKNSVGLLFCYSDMEVAPLVEALAAAVPFEVIGCTCIASMDQSEGFHEMAVTLTVLSADDCTFATAQSAPIAPGTVDACVQDAYAPLTAALGQAPALLYAIAPYNLSIMLDEYSTALNRVAEGIPVIGGLPSYNGTGDTNATIYGNEVTEDCLVLLGIAGNLRPVFSVQTVTPSAVDRKRKVTQATDNTVYRVGNQTFVEYMTEIGFPLESLNGVNDTITFVSNPVLLENVRLSGGDSFSFVRTLHKVDLSDGSGTAIGRIPVDATLSICSLERGDIEQAAGVGMRDLRAKMDANQADGYRYSTVLAVSCIGRYLLMVPRSSTEADMLLSQLPKDLALAGFYGYGEIGPLPTGLSGVLNFAHNESLVLCAF